MRPQTAPIIPQFVRFAVLGAIGTLAHYLVLVVLVEALGARPIVGSTLGFLVGAVVNYLLTRRYAFKSSVPHTVGFPKFGTIAGIGMCLNALIMAFAVSALDMHYFIAQIGATGIVLIWNYAGNRWWTFAHRS